MTKYKQINNQLFEMSSEETTAFEEHFAEMQTELSTKANLSRRAVLLAETDWYVIRATETATEVPADIVTYRQALRDITTHVNWPYLDDADWPVKPV